MTQESVETPVRGEKPTLLTRIFLNDDRLAWSMTAYTAIVVILTSVVVISCQILGGELADGSPMSETLQYHPYLSALFLAAVPSLGVLYFIAILRLNKIVGPLLRMKEHMHLIVEGQTDQPFKVRDGDKMIELIAEYNKLVDKAVGRKSA